MRRRGEQKRDGHADDPSHRRQVSVGTSGRIRVSRGARRLPSGGGLLRRRSRGARCRRVSRLRAVIPAAAGRRTRPTRAVPAAEGRSADPAGTGPPEKGGAFRIGAWERTWSEEEYGAAVEAVGGDRGRRRLPGQPRPAPLGAVRGRSAWARASPGAAAAARAASAGRRGLGDRVRLAGAVLARRGRRVWTEPIKGTRPLGSGGDLAASEKEAAET